MAIKVTEATVRGSFIALIIRKLYGRLRSLSAGSRCNALFIARPCFGCRNAKRITDVFLALLSGTLTRIRLVIWIIKNSSHVFVHWDTICPLSRKAKKIPNLKQFLELWTPMGKKRVEALLTCGIQFR